MWFHSEICLAPLEFVRHSRQKLYGSATRPLSDFRMGPGNKASLFRGGTFSGWNGFCGGGGGGAGSGGLSSPLEVSQLDLSRTCSNWFPIRSCIWK